MLLVLFNLLIVNPQIKIWSVFSVSVIGVWFENIGVNHLPYHSGNKTAKTWKEIVKEKLNYSQKPFTAAFGCYICVQACLFALSRNAKSCELRSCTGCNICNMCCELNLQNEYIHSVFHGLEMHFICVSSSFYFIYNRLIFFFFFLSFWLFFESLLTSRNTVSGSLSLVWWSLKIASFKQLAIDQRWCQTKNCKVFRYI